MWIAATGPSFYAPAEEAHGQRIHGAAGVHGDRYPQDAALTKRGEVAFGV
jgi:hypothetical protein